MELLFDIEIKTFRDNVIVDRFYFGSFKLRYKRILKLYKDKIRKCLK